MMNVIAVVRVVTMLMARSVIRLWCGGRSQVVRHGGAIAHLDAVVVVLGTALARLDVGPAVFRTFPRGVKEEEAPGLVFKAIADDSK